MDIQFTGEIVETEDGGLSVRAVVDGRTIACRFTTEVLQDVDSSHRTDDSTSQFHANQARLEQIARNKILAASPLNSPIWIVTADL